MSSRDEWMADGLCRQVGADPFFPEPGENLREAKLICGRCTVRTQCLQYALEHEERFGLWGGLSEVERRPLYANATVIPIGRRGKQITAEVEQRIVEFLKEPMTIRSIARAVGVAEKTVRRVRDGRRRAA